MKSFELYVRQEGEGTGGFHRLNLKLKFKDIDDAVLKLEKSLKLPDKIKKEKINV